MTSFLLEDKRLNSSVDTYIFFKNYIIQDYTDQSSICKAFFLIVLYLVRDVC